MEKNKVLVTEYSVWGFSFDERPHDITVGLIWLGVILFFPIWFPAYSIVQAIGYIGKKLNGVKKVEYEMEEKERYY